MKKILILLTTGIAFALSSCSVGPDFQKPQIDTLASYTYDTLGVDTMATLRWWELFNDPALDSLVIIAIEQNRDLLVAASRVEEARATLRFTGADEYPKVDIQAGAARGNSSMASDDDFIPSIDSPDAGDPDQPSLPSQSSHSPLPLDLGWMGNKPQLDTMTVINTSGRSSKNFVRGIMTSS